VEITIGVRDIARELSIEVSGDADDLASEVSAALAKAATGDAAATLDLLDTKGNRLIVPVAALAYVQIGAQEPRRVGFGTA
jgi:hypothetical protein